MQGIWIESSGNPVKGAKNNSDFVRFVISKWAISGGNNFGG